MVWNRDSANGGRAAICSEVGRFKHRAQKAAAGEFQRNWDKICGVAISFSGFHRHPDPV